MTKNNKPINSEPSLSFVFLDDEGYPTEEYIKFIKDFKPETMPIIDFVLEVLQPAWVFGFKLGRKYKGIRKLELHTGGWSGNEDIIYAIKSNICLTHFKMKYVKWYRGGHYYFEIPINTYKNG